MVDQRFSKYTDIIKNNLPYWFKMKKKPKDSLGLLFLNVFGLEIEDIDKILNYAYEQTMISSIDLQYIDTLYALDLPSNFIFEDIELISSSTSVLIETESLFELFNLGNNYDIDQSLSQTNLYFIDKDRKIIYFTEPHNKNNDYPYGKVSMTLTYEDTSVEKEYGLRYHQVWNFLDEFGALLNCTRLMEENNFSYKERILDVFRYKASSTHNGIINGISRELNTRKRYIWNGNSDYVIKNKMVLLDSICIDEEQVKIEDLFFTSEDYIVLKKELKKNDKAIVSFVVGVEVVALIDKDNVKISNELFKANGDPKDLMINYIKEIEEISSFLWGKFKYDEAVWINEYDDFKNEHFSFIPSRLDAKFSSFKNYKRCEGRRTIL